jgi:hypothetical protein
MRSFRILPLTFLVSLFGIATACGSEGKVTADAHDAAVDAPTSPMSDGGGGGGGDSGGSAPEESYGTLSLYQNQDGKLNGVGYFLPQERVDQGENIYGTTLLKRSWPCAIYEGRPADAGEIDGFVSPGNVNVTGTSLTDGPLVLTPSAKNTLVNASAKNLNAFHESEFRVVGAGGPVVPAFDETVRAPKRKITLTKPADPTKINRTTDLTIEWAEADDSAVAVVFLYSMGNKRTLSCELSGAAANGVVPASLLGQLGVGGGLFSVLFATSKRFTNAGYRYVITVGPIQVPTNVTLE